MLPTIPLIDARSDPLTAADPAAVRALRDKIQLQQIEGRCHRDGERAVIYYAFAEDTVEGRIAATVVTRMSAMDGMAGDDTSLADEIARVIVESVARRAELGDAA